MTWLISNTGTILVALALLVIVAAIVKSFIKKRKIGEGCCGGDCMKCHSDCCH